MAGGPPAQLATPIEYATGYALATPRSSFAATEERMLENQIIHFTLDFTENSNSERKKNGEAYIIVALPTGFIPAWWHEK